MKNLGPVLKRLRTGRGILQKVIAIDFGVDHAYISRLERGKATVTFQTLKRYSKLFNIPIWKIVKEAEEASGPTSINWAKAWKEAAKGLEKEVAVWYGAASRNQQRAQRYGVEVARLEVEIVELRETLVEWEDVGSNLKEIIDSLGAENKALRQQIESEGKADDK